MEQISLSAATVLTELSESTLRRRLAESTITRVVESRPKGRAMLPFGLICPHLCFPLGDGDEELIQRADEGDAEAQNDLALLLFNNNRPKAGFYWLEMAAKQDYPDALYWLGRFRISGEGIAQDENIGIMWLAKAAAKGHLVAENLMKAMLDRVVAGSSGEDRNSGSGATH